MSKSNYSFHACRLGAHYRTSGSVGTEQDISVSNIIVHEKYGSPKTYSNDIALLNKNLLYLEQESDLFACQILEIVFPLTQIKHAG